MMGTEECMLRYFFGDIMASRLALNSEPACQVLLLGRHEPWMTGPVTLSAPLLAVNDEPRV